MLHTKIAPIEIGALPKLTAYEKLFCVTEVYIVPAISTVPSSL